MKIIDKVTVALNEKRDVYEALLLNLKRQGVEVSNTTVKQYEKLLVGGIWSIITLQYFHEDGQKGSPSAQRAETIQMPHMDLEELFAGRRASRKPNGLMSSYVPRSGADAFRGTGEMALPLSHGALVENNYNVCELGPRGTGKVTSTKKSVRTAS